MKNIELKDISPKNAEFAVLDFETTGTSANSSKVIEVGIVKVKNLKIVDTYSSFINPGLYIPSYITALTGIKNEDVINAPYFEDLVDKICDFIGDSVLVAHNLSFDYSFLTKEFTFAGRELIPNPTLCTLKLARRLYPELPSKSLGNLTKHFRIRHRDVHRALGDATATAKILTRMIKKLIDEHDVETISDTINFQSMPGAKSSFRMIKKKLADDFASMPDDPGVYFFKNAKDKIIYIGKAKSLKKRVKNYFSNTAPKKAKKIVRSASRLGFKVTHSELTALITEAELIKKHNPQYNRLLKKYSQQYFIKIDSKEKFPNLNTTSKFDFDGNDYFGPYNNRETAQIIVEIASKTFKLRECTKREFAKKKKCYLADINRCLAPCIDDSIIPAYKKELEKTYEFLSGNNQIAVDRLLNKMKDCSAKRKYEEAAEIRDTVNLILNQLNKLSILSEPLNKTKVYIEVTRGSDKDYILMLEGKVFIKDYLLNESDNFDKALDDYFEGTIHIFSPTDEKDLEKMKIGLSWIVKNRNNVKLTYLSNFKSKSDFIAAIT